MVKKILDFLSVLPTEIYIFIISMLPIIERRGAIPIGAARNIPFYLNYLLAIVGNLLPIPFILLFVPRFLDFLGKFKIFMPMVRWLRAKAEKNKGKIIKEKARKEGEISEGESLSTDEKPYCGEEKSNINKKSRERLSLTVFFALAIFVAIPLPGTGAWTGSLVASLFNLPKRDSFLAIALGVLTGGVIMCLASYGIVSVFKMI